MANSAYKNVQARKVRHIPLFRPYITNFVARRGGEAAVAKSLDCSKNSVRSWCNGEAIPQLRTLLRLAEVYELTIGDTDEMLTLAGKPPLHYLRIHVANQPESSLPAILHAWRDEVCGGDTQVAADTMGIARSYFSRMANGSCNLAGTEATRRVARTLNMTIEETLEAAGLRNSPLAKKFKKLQAGVPGYLRSLMERHGFDPFEVDARGTFAKEAKITESRFIGLLSGTVDPSVIDAQRLAALTDLPLTEVLIGLGYEEQTAHQLSAGVHAAPKNVATPLSALLRSYRKKAGVSQAAVASAIGTTWPSTVTFYEMGRSTPPLKALTTIATVTNAPLGRLLRAGKYIV